jgi:hypothetical protein
MDRHCGAVLDFEIHVRAVRQNQAGDNQTFSKKDIAQRRSIAILRARFELSERILN